MTTIDDARVLAPAGRRDRLSRWLAVIGPAWIVMVADVDAPSVVTAGRAGTIFGYGLVLPLLALIPVLYLVQEMTSGWVS